MKEVVEVAVGLPISKTFHYLIPERMRASDPGGDEGPCSLQGEEGHRIYDRSGRSSSGRVERTS